MADIHIPVAVSIIRPAHPGVRPPLFKAIEPPSTKLTLGSKVHLEIRFYRQGQLWLIAPTGAEGTVISVVSLYLDAVEVIVRKDAPSGIYVYLIVPLEEKYITLPPRLFAGYLLIEPYLLALSMTEAGGDTNNETTSEEFTEYLSRVGFRPFHGEIRHDAEASDSGYESNSVMSLTEDEEEKDDGYDIIDRDVDGGTSRPIKHVFMASGTKVGQGYAENAHMMGEPHLAFQARRRKLRFWTKNSGSLSRTPLRRPANSVCGGVYEVIERPSRPLRLGMRVSLNLNYLSSSNRHGVFVHPWITISTGIQGLIMGIEGMRTDALIFLVCDESFGNAYEYLLVTTIFPGFIELPQSVWMGYTLVKCTLLSTAVGLSRGDEYGGFPWAVGLCRGDEYRGSSWRPGVSDFVSWTPGSDASSMQTSSVSLDAEDHEGERRRSPKAQGSVDWIRASSFRRTRQDRSRSSEWIGLDAIMEEGSSSAG
ncbi:hypothetical protein C8Q76DRAFT_694687 [Earliella scabrosa]|nr:hypothetical protein C8Q76DRAFT_694687 [Earliella scabrosa]